MANMSRRLLLTGPGFSSLESRAFDILTDAVGTQPENILYLANGRTLLILQQDNVANVY